MSDLADRKHYFKLHINHMEDVSSDEIIKSDDVDNVNAKIAVDKKNIDFIDKITNYTVSDAEVVYDVDNTKYSDVVEANTTKINNKKYIKNDIKTIRGVFSDIGRQLTVSFIVLVIGFVAMNAASFYEIAQYKLNEFRGVKSPLHEIASEVKEVTYSQEILTTSEDPEIQKKQVPPLDLEVAPVDDRIIIPKIDKNIPIIRIGSENVIKRDWKALETQMQDALKNGVVYYPGTAQPGQSGNVVVTGHSSYFPWDPGRFKDVFALLHEVAVGDNIVVYHDQDKYLYQITEIKVVQPEDVNVLKQTVEDRLTLITCTPVGTNLKRLIVIAKPIQINNNEISEQIVR